MWTDGHAQLGSHQVDCQHVVQGTGHASAVDLAELRGKKTLADDRMWDYMWKCLALAWQLPTKEIQKYNTCVAAVTTCIAPVCRNCLNIVLFWHISPVATPIPYFSRASLIFLCPMTSSGEVGSSIQVRPKSFSSSIHAMASFTPHFCTYDTKGTWHSRDLHWMTLRKAEYSDDVEELAWLASTIIMLSRPIHFLIILVHDEVVMEKHACLIRASVGLLTTAVVCHPLDWCPPSSWKLWSLC